MKNTYQHSLESDLRQLRTLFNNFNDVAVRAMRKLDIKADAAGYCKRPKIQLIQEQVAAHYKMPVTIMTSKLRPAVFIEPRHVAIYLACDLTKYNTTEIGKCFNKEHSTISAARSSIADRISTEPDFANQLAALHSVIERQLEHIDLPLLA